MNTTLMPASEAGLERAARLIRAGEVVAFPTETVYGLGANALDADAVRKIFEAKGRPGDNPLIVHIARLEQLDGLVKTPLPPLALRLAGAYWPGPMTMILKKTERIPDAVSAGLDTVGIRLPAHPAARALIERAGCPIAAPSANRSGRPSPTLASHVLEDMDGRIALILDGGACEVGLESTVVDLTADRPRVLRPGGVTREMIERVAGAADVDEGVLRPLAEGERPRSPGMKYRHYAPRGRLTIVRGSDKRVAQKICKLYDEACARGGRAAILALSANAPAYAPRRVRALGADAGEVAGTLFAALREMDEAGVTDIFAEAVDARGVGLAVMNRMGRAAAFHVINAEE